MKKYFILFFVSFILFNSCADKEDLVPQDIEVQHFIWKGLNLYYYWLENVPDLQDSRFKNQDALNSFLQGKEPIIFFEDLLYDGDQFSWIVDDYVALENSFQGINLTTGMKFGLVAISANSDVVFGYVRYVIPGSSADQQGISRGDIFYAVNGQDLTQENYYDLLFSNDTTLTLDFADYAVIGGTPTLTPNGIQVSLTKEELQENPIQTTTVNDISGHKIGYLHYTQFASNYDVELNQVFADFKGQGITDLVLDLRYNGGGSVDTAVFLSQMITGQFTGDIFGVRTYNYKLQSYFEENATIYFTDKLLTGETILDLGLSKLYVLVSGSTASASELVINGLDPYIDVQLIGTQTVGKTVASVTLYDSEDFTKNNVNPNHTYALQPIVLEIKNKLGENHPDGFVPDFYLPEDFANLGTLGDVSEPLFAKAIDEIIGIRRNVMPVKELKLINDNQKNNMYIDL